jgi:hypothetical protein
MANPSWLDDVRKRLFRQGLPPSYVQRFMDELSDHVADLKEENMEGDAVSRLGEPEQVADNAVAAYRRRSFLGRHPTAAFLVFGLSPVVSFIVLSVLAAGLFELCCVRLWGTNLAGLRHFGPWAVPAMPYVMSLLTVVIPCILASILYCRLAWWLGIGKKWMLLSCAMLAVLGSMSYCFVNLSPLPGHHALLWGGGIPITIGQLASVFCRPRQLLQFLVPLAIGWWFLRRKPDQGRLQLAS